MPIGAAAIIGGSTLLGTYMANKQSAANAEAANATSIELANTSYQRRVQDLSKAGLNPMLAYSQGGAAVPNIQTPTVQNYGDAASSAVQGYQSGVNQDLVRSQIKTQETQQEVNKAMAIKAAADAEVSTASAAEVRARTGIYSPMIQETLARIDKIGADTGLSFAQTQLVKRQAINAVYQGENIQANTGNTKADTMLKFVFKDLSSYQLNSARNQSEFADTAFGRNIAPWLPSLLDMSQIYGNIKPRGGGGTYSPTTNNIYQR